MRTTDWGQIVFFHAADNWGDPMLMDYDFVKTVDQYRSFTKIPMIVSCGTQGEHAQLSLHYSGLAGDFVFPTKNDFTLFDLYLTAFRFPFTEVGIYPQWRYNGREVGGLHLGRSKGPIDHKKTWIGLDTETGRQYTPVTQQSLAAHGI